LRAVLIRESLIFLSVSDSEDSPLPKGLGLGCSPHLEPDLVLVGSYSFQCSCLILDYIANKNNRIEIIVCFDVGLLSGVLSKFYVDVKQFYAQKCILTSIHI
jgi:hypothetical protein